MARHAPSIPIDAAIKGAEKILASPRVNSGLKAYQRGRLERLKALKARGVKEIKLGQQGV